MISNIKLKIKNIRFEFLLGGILLLIIAVLVIFLFKRNMETAIDNSTTNTLSEIKYLEIPESKTIFINNFKISLPENWIVKSHYQAQTNSFLSCTSLCEVFEVTDSNSTFYITSPSALTQISLSQIQNENTSITLFNKEVTLISEALEIVSRDDKSENGQATISDRKFIRQSYLCNSDKICISSGLLPGDINLNSSEYVKFKNFIPTLSLQDN